MKQMPTHKKNRPFSKKKAIILNNVKVADGYFKLSLDAPWMAQARPGQFMQVKIGDDFKTLLRKPFGFHRIITSGDRKSIEILYKVIGPGTEALSKKNSRGSLDIIGPLGNGFDVSTAKTRRQATHILVAGGIGVAPLVALAETLAPKGKVYALIGASARSHILCEKEFKNCGAETLVTTEDGSKGKKGLITDCLKALLSTMNHQLSTIYACGPKAMLKEVSRLSKKKRIPCQILLEEYMACGVGVCLGCAVMTKEGYKMVCEDGPVFDAREIVWK